MSDKPYSPGVPSTGGKPIVYVREAARETLPDEIRNMSGPVYALHDEAGNQIALAADRKVAFALARRNDLKPLSVH